MKKKYNIIYADPPWSYDDPSLNRGGAKRHYDTMEIEDIYNIPVQDISNDNCILFMWATFPKLIEGINTIKEWGFKYKTIGFLWVKTNKRFNSDQATFFPADSLDHFTGMGRWTRSNSEICLIGTKGNIERKSASVHQIIYDPIMKHSKKPDVVRDKIIELVGDLPRIELFARNKTEGWDLFGNEVESDVTL